MRSIRPGAGGSIRSLRQLRQQLVAYPFMAALPLGDMLGQPRGELLRVGHRALPEAKLLTDLRAMALDRATRPLV